MRYEKIADIRDKVITGSYSIDSDGLKLDPFGWEHYARKLELLLSRGVFDVPLPQTEISDEEIEEQFPSITDPYNEKDGNYFESGFQYSAKQVNAVLKGYNKLRQEGAKWMRSQLSRIEPEKESVKEVQKPVYTLNCDKCGTPFYSEDAFPTNQLCMKCYVEHPEKDEKPIELRTLEEMLNKPISEKSKDKIRKVLQSNKTDDYCHCKYPLFCPICGKEFAPEEVHIVR
jgi:predicted Zn-ribbon and HTH transcriptional regulator